MRIKEIKKDRWYETNVGVGLCTQVGGTFPATVKIHITYPLPRGVVNVCPRDVYAEVAPPEVKP